MINILCVFGLFKYLISLKKQEVLLPINSNNSVQAPVPENEQEYRTYKH